MANHTIGIINALALAMVSGLLIFSYKFKRKSKAMTLADFETAFDLQEQVIYHSGQAIMVFSTLLQSMSELVKFKQEWVANLNQNAHNELATAFKEVSYRVNEQVGTEKNGFNYSLIVGDCFADTKNCLLVLNDIIRDVGKVAIPDIVSNFKLSLAN